MTAQRPQRVSAWVVSLGFFGLALMYLNEALFAAWMSGGPPNPHPLGWERRAYGELSLALASLLLAAGGYKLVVSLPDLRRWAVALVIAGVALALAPYAGRELLHDECLDRGGQWSNLALECTHQ